MYERQNRSSTFRLSYFGSSGPTLTSPGTATRAERHLSCSPGVSLILALFLTDRASQTKVEGLGMYAMIPAEALRVWLLRFYFGILASWVLAFPCCFRWCFCSLSFLGFSGVPTQNWVRCEGTKVATWLLICQGNVYVHSEKHMHIRNVQQTAWTDGAGRSQKRDN